jgi:hypothetical protein
LAAWGPLMLPRPPTGGTSSTVTGFALRRLLVYAACSGLKPAPWVLPRMSLMLCDPAQTKTTCPRISRLGSKPLLLLDWMPRCRRWRNASRQHEQLDDGTSPCIAGLAQGNGGFRRSRGDGAEFMTSLFSDDEIRFLARHGYSEEDVYDGRYQSKARRAAGAKSVGKHLVLAGVIGRGTCGTMGHRLRTRAGHCIQCNPKNIGFQRREDTPGYV